MEINAKQTFSSPPAPVERGGWRFWICAKTWCLMIMSLSLLSSLLATLKWGGVWSLVSRICRDGMLVTASFQAVQKEGDLYWRSHHWQNPTALLMNMVKLSRKEGVQGMRKERSSSHVREWWTRSASKGPGLVWEKGIHSQQSRA